MASLAIDKNSTPDPVLMALEALLNEQSDSDIRKLLKKECSLSTGKAQAALREAKKKQETNAANDASGESKSAAGSLCVPSSSLKCGICCESIHRGTTAPGPPSWSLPSTVATTQCEHYFCFNCLGGYAKHKINQAEVDEDEMDCPHAMCSKSMLQDTMGRFTPNYLFRRSGGQAEGILGNAFSFQEACDLNEKFLNHRIGAGHRKLKRLMRRRTAALLMSALMSSTDSNDVLTQLEAIFGAIVASTITYEDLKASLPNDEKTFLSLIPQIKTICYGGDQDAAQGCHVDLFSHTISQLILALQAQSKVS